MAESQENIEAKLIAFVEGDLDAAGRAEIEQHLAANPTHRKLLDELMRTRQYVRQLPRAKAPPELVETLQGQLERSALLDNIGTDAGSLQLRSNRWPQLISIAAVVLLALGLAAVVYMALPRDDRQTIARDTNDGAATTTRPAARTTRPSGQTVSTITIAPPEAAIPTAAVPGAPDTTAMVARAGDPSNAATPEVAEMAAKDDAAAPVPPISPVATAKPTDLTPMAVAAAANEQTSTTLPAAVEVATANEPALQRQMAQQQQMQLQPQEYDEALYVVVNAANPAMANDRVASYLSQNQIDYQNVVPNMTALENVRQSQRATVGLTAPLHGGDVAMQNNTEPGSKAEAGALSDASVDGEARSTNAVQADRQLQQLPLVEARVAQQIFAKRMTRQQVTELQTAIAEPDVALIEPPPPSPDALQPGDEVEITVNELVGPGVEKTNRAKIAADGNVTMPMVEPVRAQGLTPEALSAAITQRYQDSSLIDRPTVTVARVSPALPTTAPIGAPAEGAATTLPATNPTTQAIATVAADPDAPVDVMIVVQTAAPVVPPAATTLPATQPTTMSATQPATAPATQATTQTTTAPVEAIAAEPSATTLPAATQPATVPAEMEPVLEGIMP
ncbi:MAG TPA: polysaccharide biosynthesis/export family protein [Tepidisphaeraceae bacterium]|jgi:hypothetical protein|nr:polysaccharide biosynthesis/export family protein [Tepidisphaeraceae bacterium]